MKNGANIDIKSNKGNTPLHLAADHCSEKGLPGDYYLNVIKYLISKGASLNIGNKMGGTPTMYTKRYICPRHHAFLKSKGGILISGGPPVNNNIDPAARAVFNSDLNAIKNLKIQEFYKINARSEWGTAFTPLHLAVEKGNPEVIDALIAKNADWNTKDIYWQTPLHIAVQSKNKNIIEKLLNAGADPNQGLFINSEELHSAYSMAISFSENLELFELLKKSGKKPLGNDVIISAVWKNDYALSKKLLLRNIDSAVKNPYSINHSIVISGNPKHKKLLNILFSRKYRNTSSGKNTADSLRSDSMKTLGIQHKNLTQYKKDIRHWKPPSYSPGKISSKRGNFRYTMPSWAPGEKGHPGASLENIPLDIYIPKSYNDSESYGLIFFLHGRARSGAPNPSYAKVMDKHKLIWIGYDAYLGKAVPFHDQVNQAAIYHMMKNFNINRNRIYMSGLSWGGRVSCKLLGYNPNLYTGMIPMGGCLADQFRREYLPVARDLQIPLVITAGDHDYNRAEAFDSYLYLRQMGFKNVYYLQDPEQHHSILTAKNLDKAIGLLNTNRHYPD